MDPKTLAFIIGVVVLAVVLSVLSSIKSAARKKLEKEYYQKMSGRATGTITNRNITKELREKRSDEDKDEYDYICYVSYTFVVNGQTYTGYGEGARSGKAKKEQTICYDPADPNTNCTEYYYKKKTDNNVVGQIISVILVLGIAAFAFCVWQGIIKL